MQRAEGGGSGGAGFLRKKLRRDIRGDCTIVAAGISMRVSYRGAALFKRTFGTPPARFRRNRETV
jgi:hypothetical protein